MEITLNETEQRLVRYMAQCRYDYSRSVHAELTIYHDVKPLEAEIDSFGAEVAYCHIKNVYPDLDYTHFNYYDAIVQGKKVDVKFTTRQNGRMLVKPVDGKQLPDVYALMIGKFPRYRLAGEILASSALKNNYMDMSLPNPAYAIPQERLWQT